MSARADARGISKALPDDVARASFLDTVRAKHRPALTIAWARENVPFQTPELIESFVEGLRKARLDQ